MLEAEAILCHLQDAYQSVPQAALLDNCLHAKVPEAWKLPALCSTTNKAEQARLIKK